MRYTSLIPADSAVGVATPRHNPNNTLHFSVTMGAADSVVGVATLRARERCVLRCDQCSSPRGIVAQTADSVVGVATSHRL